MSAPLFLAAALGAFAVSLIWLAYYIRHACDDLSVPDCHGDVPAIPDEVIERALVDAQLRALAELNPLPPEAIN